MKKFLSLILIASIFASLFPINAYAIDSDTHVFPVVGNISESSQEYLNEKIDLAPIKLPKKVGRFELLEAERALAPNLLKNQVGLWTAPLRTKFRDLPWLLPASGILTALFLTDNEFSQVLSDNHNPSRTQTDLAQNFAKIGGYAPVLGLPGGLILTGAITKNKRMRETGVLQYEGLFTSQVLWLAVSRISGRNKPNNKRKGRGEFFEGGTSFPSGHSISSWTLASVAAHQYPDKKWVAVLGYTLASLISASRAVQGTHFPSDIFAGAVAGYLIGKYIVKHRSKHSPKNKEQEGNP